MNNAFFVLRKCAPKLAHLIKCLDAGMYTHEFKQATDEEMWKKLRDKKRNEMKRENEEWKQFTSGKQTENDQRIVSFSIEISREKKIDAF